jgi:PadR family transcriptional regulator, regulatory protein PadR
MNDLMILAMLLEGPQHGYALKKKVGLVTGRGEMHSNLVYPLLKRFVSQGWVSRRTAGGQRGQTREIYALSAKGKNALAKNLSEFGEKAAGSGEAFRFRVSLFFLLDPSTQQNILLRRDEWLSHREQHFRQIAEGTGARGWSKEVIEFLKKEVQAERKWIERLRRKTGRRGTGKGKD